MAINVESINDEHLYSVREWFEILQVEEQTIRNYLKNSSLKGTKGNNKRWIVRGIDLKRFLG